MPYPSFSAGQRVTAALLNAGKLEKVTKGSAQNSTTTTLADITSLLFTCEAGAVYIMHVEVAYDSPTANDIKFDWTVPTGGSMARSISALGTGATDNSGAGGSLINIRRGNATAQGGGGTGGTTNAFSTWREHIVFTSVDAGTVQMRFAMNAGATGPAIVQAESFFTYQRVA